MNPEPREDWRTLLDAVLLATQRIEERYFRLAVAEQTVPAIRERVYCYELYHRLREELPSGVSFPYTLHGEVDKRGHRVMEQLLCGLNPDFIVHRPGVQSPDSNLAVMEVKACGSYGSPPTKDADSLVAFVDRAKYVRAVALVFGGSSDQLTRHIRTVFAGAVPFSERIEVLWHHECGRAAECIPEWWRRVDR